MRRLSDERGNVAIIVSLMLLTLLGASALAIDVGAMTVQQARLRTGTDAAALAIAERCAADAVDATATACVDDVDVSALAQEYIDANVWDVDTVATTVDASYGGDAGTVTVVGRSSQPAMFGAFLDVPEQRVAAHAVARWGPLVGADAVFPLVVCTGVDITPGTELQLAVDPASADDPDICLNEPDVQPIGWLEPDDAGNCTRSVVTTPPDLLQAQPIDDLPGAPGCSDAFNDLFDAIATAADTDARTRVLAVSDRQYGGPSAGPADALIALEFTGLRFGGEREEHLGPDWTGDCTRSDVWCVRGVVREWVPPVEGPIADPAVDPAAIDDTTVLHVRLVE